MGCCFSKKISDADQEIILDINKEFNSSFDELTEIYDSQSSLYISKQIELHDSSELSDQLQPEIDWSHSDFMRNRPLNSDVWLCNNENYAIKQQKVNESQIGLYSVYSKLHHPNIIKCHGFRIAEEYSYFLLEHLPGVPLHTYIKNIDVKRLKEIIIEMVSVVDFLHKNGIHHQNISLSSFIINENTLKLVDFNFITSISENSVKVKPGSPYYAAPEIFLTDYDNRADIWALGICIYMMMTQKHPFNKPSAFNMDWQDFMASVCFEEPTYTEIADADCKEVLQGILTKDPNKRWTCEQVLTSKWLA